MGAETRNALADAPARTNSLFGGRTPKAKAPASPPLPKGWAQATCHESGKTYYYHKRTRHSTFQFPTTDHVVGVVAPIESSEAAGGDSKGFSHTLSKLTGRHRDTQHQSVLLSCSALIQEVKLCVSVELHPQLDGLLGQLGSREMTAAQAVRKLEGIVGSTIAQQASLSVTNAQNGVLPHGWLQYATPSGEPYYYNVHTKVTTWYQPTGPVPPPPPRPDAAEKEDVIEIDVKVETHNVAVSGFI